ncbi:MAG: deoxyribodipyrimidine photo-lyase [Candidatus Lernaella stagnicola]|nr:deoxyribodipyrimidine photo-lyase [Candidatus Lernaella stagnicola]
MIQNERIRVLQHGKRERGDYVLYWMQVSQRVVDNHALEHAVDLANQRDLPVLVFFGLTGVYPQANLRHYRFMIEGLIETAAALERRGIKFVVQQTSPPMGARRLARRAAIVVTDCGYTRVQRDWRRDLAARVEAPFIQVESDVVVPVTTASGKDEFGAYTLRPKIYRLLDDFLVPVRKRRVKKQSLGLSVDGRVLPLDVDAILRRLRTDRSVAPVVNVTGGTAAAKRRLQAFLRRDLDRYADERNDPNANATSGLSAYLHFGNISPLTIALATRKVEGKGKAAFLEELIVRRELAMNFCFFNERYDSFDGLPPWALKTLGEHAADPREYEYEWDEWENAATHDPYWNAAQNEMRFTGRMHGYMRMYWGKKILEWTRNPRRAYEIAVALNDRYELDGRDPNGYAGIAWCLGKHDRAWGERPVFGKIRYMNDKGLRRKFDADAYVRRVAALAP